MRSRGVAALDGQLPDQGVGERVQQDEPEARDSPTPGWAGSSSARHALVALEELPVVASCVFLTHFSIGLL